MSEGAFPETPVARGLFLCDLVIAEEKTKKVSLINHFDIFRAPRFPSPPRPFVVYSLLSDGFGEVTLRCVIESLKDNEEVYSGEFLVTFGNRLQAVHFRLQLNEISFPEPGFYEILLFANSQPVAQTRVKVSE